MSAPSYIRRHINNLVGDKPFSIRDFLIYGDRNTIDQIFHRLIVEGRIVRVARGVYIKGTSPQPSIAEIIEVKVKAFGRTVAAHGSQAARRLRRQGQDKLVFATDGATSSFRVGNRVVHLVRTSVRKMRLGDDPSGLVIRALWHLGKRGCEPVTAALLVENLGRYDKIKLRLAAASMPQWMRQCLASFARMDCLRRDWQTLPVG
ncbi:MAG: hypothetical protein C5B53_09855 [Candidatus Melainabacteria bacterium]|nr:MAG: hypothetical protein C5B53_09855 [Candidatus Melainabacteria bacterium]